MSIPLASRIQSAFELHLAQRLQEAEHAYRAILAEHPGEPNCCQMLGVILTQRGAYDEAEPLLLRALQQSDTVPQWHGNYALLCRATGRLDKALTHLQRAIQLNPAIPELHDQLGLVLQDLHYPDQAAAAFANAIALHPQHAAAHAHLAINRWRAGAAEAAINHWRRAIELQPGDVDSLAQLGFALTALGDAVQGMSCFEQALQQAPDHRLSLTYAGLAAYRQGRFAQAVAYLERAIELHPGDSESRALLGLSLYAQGQIDPAIDVCTKLVETDPTNVEAWISLGTFRLGQGDFEQAIACCRRALELQPAHAKARSNLLLYLHYDPNASQQSLFEQHLAYGSLHEPPTLAVNDRPRDPDRPLRIAYLSPYFRRHAVSCFVEPFIEAHDHSRFVISCYSDTRAADEVTDRLRSRADHWYDAADLNDEALAQAIRQNREDIVVDLTGHIAGDRLATLARRPAPVQITYLGYQNTTGLRSVQYRLTDDIADPTGVSDAFYTERLLRLPCFFCYRPSAEAPEVGPPPSMRTRGITFGSLNTPAKVNAAVVDVWARLLHRVPDSRVMLLINAQGECASRLADMFAAHGISADRLHLALRAPQREYYELYQQIDIALDPFPFSGHTTTCDALWMGLPVVTLAGRSYASRMSPSVLTHLGRREWVAEDVAEYLQIAERLANDRDGLAQARTAQREHMRRSVITDAVQFTRHLEAAYQRAWSERASA